jgi:hypothetical protein
MQAQLESMADILRQLAKEQEEKNKPPENTVWFSFTNCKNQMREAGESWVLSGNGLTKQEVLWLADALADPFASGNLRELRVWNNEVRTLHEQKPAHDHLSCD